MLRLISLLSVLFLIPLNATATEINEQGAQKLKSSYQAVLDYQKTVNEAFGSVQVIYEGELTVSQEKDYYKVTFPKISLKSPEINGKTDGFVFDIGIITLNTMPDDKPEYWKTTLMLPSKMTMSDRIKEEDLTINIGEQSTIALFNDRLGYFTKINMNLSQIGFKFGEKDLGFNLGGFQLYTNTEEDESRRFSGPGHILLSDIVIAPPNEGESVEIGELKFDFTMKDFEFPTLQEYKEKLLKHSDTFQSLGNLEQDADLEALNAKNVTDMVFDLYDFDMDGFSFQYSIKDFEINSDPNEEFKDFDSFKLGSAFIGFGFEGLSVEKGKLNIKTGYDTIDIQPSDPEFRDILPQNANFDIKAESIPYGTLAELGKTSVLSVVENPDSANMVGIGLLMRLPAILSQSGTEVVLENNAIKNGIYALTLDGKVMTDLTAMLSFSAKFKAIFEGLDSILAIAKKHAENTESENASGYRDLASTLEILKSLGQSETGSNGKVSYSFNFETTPEGQLLVNGQDASTISFE